jgi:tetratricopeptide (TPR) repeat protein
LRQPVVFAVVALLVAGAEATAGSLPRNASASGAEGRGAASGPAERPDLDAARRLLETGRAQEAADLLEPRVAAAPQDADALILLGTARALLAQRSRSLQALRQAVSLQPGKAAAQHALCMALARFGEVEEARQSCEAALRADPRLAEAHVNLALILAAQDQPVEAEAHLTRALALEERAELRAQAFYLRGRLRRQLGRPKEAIPDLAQAVRLRPDLAAAQLELGLARIDDGDARGALLPLQRAVELEPESFEARFALGSQYLREGEAARALSHLRKAQTLRPDDREVVYSLGRALRATGGNEEAAALLKQLAERSRGRAVADADVREAGRLNNEGVELEARGDYEGALERYRAAVAIHPQDPRFRKNVGLALCRLGRWEEAKAELREVLKESPGEPDALKALYVALEHAPDPGTREGPR